MIAFTFRLESDAGLTLAEIPDCPPSALVRKALDFARGQDERGQAFDVYAGSVLMGRVDYDVDDWHWRRAA